MAIHAYSAQSASFRMVTQYGEPDTLLPPLLTFVLWLFHHLGIHPEWGIKLVFILSQTATAIVLHRFTLATFGRQAANYTLLFFLTLPVFNSVMLGSETHALLLLCQSLLTLQGWKMLSAPHVGTGTVVSFGIFGGLAYLSRAEGLTYFILFFFSLST